MYGKTIKGKGPFVDFGKEVGLDMLSDYASTRYEPNACMRLRDAIKSYT